MQALDCMVCVLKRVSMDRMSETILKAHERTGCKEHISWDVFRKKLQAAVLELGYIKAQLEIPEQLGAVDHPSGLFSSCGGCWFAGKQGVVRPRPGLLQIHCFHGKYKLVRQLI